MSRERQSSELLKRSKVAELLKRDPDLTTAQIGARIGLPRDSVRRIVRALKTAQDTHKKT